MDIRREDFQVVYFLKRSGNEPIKIHMIEDQVIAGILEREPLDDLL